MISERLNCITNFLEISDKIIDIGCDHAYVPIKMAKKGAKKLLATDIHENALEIARQNIVNENLTNTIELQLSDGLEKVNTLSYDTLVICGMGASTIMHILNDKDKLKSIKKIILQSNNDLKELRIFMNKLSYSLQEEKVLFEKGHYYTIMKYMIGKDALSDIEYELGLFQKENKEYYEYLKDTWNRILKNIPETQNIKKQELEYKINLVECYLKQL